MIRHLPTLLLLLCFAPASAEISSAPAPKPKFPLEKSTTFLTGPLRPDGTVDYLKGLKLQLEKGITKDNNAFVAFVGITGTEGQIDVTLSEPLLKQYGIGRTPGVWVHASSRFKREEIAAIDNEIFALRFAPWKREDHVQIARWIDDNKPALELLAKACLRERYQVPLHSNNGTLVQCKLPSLKTYRYFSYVLNARATLRMAEGDLAGAQEDLLTSHRLARLLSQGNTLIERVLACGIENNACEGDFALATCGKLSAKELRAYAAQTAKLPTLQPASDAIDLSERCMVLETITRLYDADLRALVAFLNDNKEFVGDGSSPGFRNDDVPFTDADLAGVDYAEVLRHINRCFDDRIAASKITDPKKRRQAGAGIEDRVGRAFGELPANASATDRYRHFAAKMLFPHLSRAVEFEHTARARGDLARLSLALAAYRADYSAYPDTLDPLTPDYIPSIPKDPFSGEPFRYRRDGNGFVLYSFGTNLKDDDGTPPAPEKPGDGDIVFKTGK